MKLIKNTIAVLFVLLSTVCVGCGPSADELGPGTINVMVAGSVAKEAEAGAVGISSVEAIVSSVVVYPEKAEEGEGVSLYVANKSLSLLKTLEQNKFLAFVDLDAASFEKVVLTIDKLDVIFTDGTERVITPSQPFEFAATIVVFADRTTTLTFTFNIDKTVAEAENGDIAIKPIVGITMSAVYEEEK